MMKPDTKIRKTQFTLIELLIVISIIIILISILMPALSKAKGKAKIIACTSNLKQQILVCSSYAGDWNDSLPYNYVIGTPHPANSYNVSRYLSTIYPDYIQNGRIYYCPGNYNMTTYNDKTYEKNFYPSNPGGSWTRYFYFGWNQYGNATYESPYRLSKKVSYSDIISCDVYSAGNDESLHGTPAQINTLYQDGHVKMRMPLKAWLK